MDLINLPGPKEIVSILRSEKCVRKLEEAWAITERGKEAGLLIGVSPCSETYFSEVKEGDESMAPSNIFLPPLNILYVDIHSHPSSSRLGYICPSPIDVIISKPGFVMGEFSKKGIDFCEGRITSCSSQEMFVSYEEEYGLKRRITNLNEWRSYVGIAGIVNGTRGVLVYECMPDSPGKEALVDRISQGLRNGFESQAEIVRLIQQESRFAEFLVYS